MKPHIPYAFLAMAAACGIALGQAYTTPVGYITHEINANTGLESVTIISPSLIQPQEFAAAASSSPSGSATIEFAGAVPDDLDSSYVLEVTSEGDQQGWWSTVLSSTASSITINDAFPAGLPANVSVSVRKHSTIMSFLGANNPGLVAFDGVAENDEVQILDAAGVPQSVDAIVWVPESVSGAPDSWFYLADTSPANDAVIEPGAAIVIKRVSSTPLSFTSVGEVKITPTQVDIFPGFNWVGTFNAVGNTLDGMGFATSLIPFDGAGENFDELQFINPDQSATAYAALDPSLGAGETMGDLSTGTPAGDDPFAEGTGAIIKRSMSESAGTITIPGSVVAE